MKTVKLLTGLSLSLMLCGVATYPAIAQSSSTSQSSGDSDSGSSRSTSSPSEAGNGSNTGSDNSGINSQDSERRDPASPNMDEQMMQENQNQQFNQFNTPAEENNRPMMQMEMDTPAQQNDRQMMQMEMNTPNQQPINNQDLNNLPESDRTFQQNQIRFEQDNMQPGMSETDVQYQQQPSTNYNQTTPVRGLW